MRDTTWLPTIGLEVHVQLSTQSKIFSSAATRFGDEPNRFANLVDVAMPGTLPVLNEAALHMAIRFGLAINAEISNVCRFDRKNYFYPDLPKGYQISQLAQPIVGRGVIEIVLDDGSVKSVGITRAHLEEDAGKSLHDAYPGQTAIDLNRAGTPLLEIVTDPDLSSPAEAAVCFRYLRSLVTWLQICDGRMAEGSMRCDANVSVRPNRESDLGERTEIKNLNSFRFVEKALEYEIERQVSVLESGGTIERATMHFDTERMETRPLRSKELSDDYRYFPDPDLLPVVVDTKMVEAVRASMPELPTSRRDRYVSKYQLSEYDARRLTQDIDTSEFFEQAVETSGNPKLAANWVLGDLAAALNRDDLTVAESPVQPNQLGLLLNRISDDTISGKIAKTIFDVIWSEGGDVDQIIAERGLQQVTNRDALQSLVDEVVAQHPDQVDQFRQGKSRVLGFFVGQVMRASGGKADPRQVSELLRNTLSA